MAAQDTIKKLRIEVERERAAKAAAEQREERLLTMLDNATEALRKALGADDGGR